MTTNPPIQYYNRETGGIETETVYGEGFLRWAYGNPLGRLTVELAVKRAWFSRWYGWRMDRPASRAKIKPFIEDYGLDPAEFADPVESFASFNEFFYRRLKPEARPVDPAPETAVFPAEGRHLAVPDIDEAETFYVKGQRFDRRSFLADDALAAEFKGGAMLVSRLCPVDYHRYHFPVGGEAGAPVPINGPLYSVSPLALRRNLAILWENKRLRTLIDSPAFGKVVLMEIGATCVGSIHSTSTAGAVEKGREKGYFSFGGSCVVTLFQAGRIRFDADLLEHSARSIEVYAKVGERCGVCRGSIR
ncbi:MAG: archaetidylserine decarboxylase [Opitutales bacterium]